MPISIEEILTQIKPVVVGWIKASIQQSDAGYTPMLPVSSLFSTGPCGYAPAAQNLAEITTSIGIIGNGEFRLGTGDPTSDGASPFSGVRIAYPPLDYNSASWHLVGVDNDVLQFGMSASSGAAYFGRGRALLNASGLTLTTASESPGPATLDPESQIKWTRSGCLTGYMAGWISGAKRLVTIGASTAAGEAKIDLEAEGASPAITITAANGIELAGPVTINASAVYPPYIVRQTADESASTATLQNSNVLYFPIQANEVWVARFVCPMTMAAAGGLRAAVTRPVSPSSFYAAGIYIAVLGSTNSTDSGLTTTGSGIFISNANLGTSGRLEVDISIANGANAGNVTLRFAQSASNATATVVKAGAYMQAQRIS